METKVKTFVYGLCNGLTDTMKGLDEAVAELGDIDILDINDMLVNQGFSRGNGPQIMRRVIYKCKKHEER